MSVGCETTEPKGGFWSISCRSQPERRGRSAGVTMTKAGGKGGNLRDKLDGNELDLSLSDLNEVPVKELVSAVAGPGVHRACPWPWRGPPPSPRPRGEALESGGERGAEPPPGRPLGSQGSSEMYTCPFGAGPGDGVWGRGAAGPASGFARVKSKSPPAPSGGGGWGFTTPSAVPDPREAPTESWENE